MHARRHAIGAIIFSFALGGLLSFILPVWLLAVAEAIALVFIGWCFFCD